MPSAKVSSARPRFYTVLSGLARHQMVHCPLSVSIFSFDTSTVINSSQLTIQLRNDDKKKFGHSSSETKHGMVPKHSLH